MKSISFRRAALVALVLSGVFVLNGCAFFAASYQPEPMVLELEESLLEEGRFEQDKNLYAVLPPTDRALSPSGKREAIIFYPGGKVEPLAYLPLWDAVAQTGYAVFVPAMPLDLAVFGVGAAAKIRSDHPEYEVWHLAGHSLGGAMAAEHLKKDGRGYRSLILLGSYPASDLSGLDLAALSIKEDSGLEGSLEKAKASLDKLPAGALFRVMPGANHAQFGRYGIQKGDGTALLSPEAQTALSREWILEFLAEL